MSSGFLTFALFEKNVLSPTFLKSSTFEVHFLILNNIPFREVTSICHFVSFT